MTFVKNRREMKSSQEHLIDDLIKRIENSIAEIEKFSKNSEEFLNRRVAADSWSVLECIEHLNRYNDFYLPEVQRVLAKARPGAPEKFSSGWLGDYFAKSMLPKEKLNKMKTFASMNPIGSVLQISTLNKYLEDLKKWTEILENCREYNLSKLKTNISISKIIKLRLGDTLRVVIYHQNRHLAQMKRLAQSV